MPDRFWVGGSGTWDTTSTTNWSTTRGGAGGASVPTINDSVYFTATSTFTVTCTGALTCQSLNVEGGGGVITFVNGTSPTFSINGPLRLNTSSSVWNTTGTITFIGSSDSEIRTNGTTLNSSIVINKATEFGYVPLVTALTTTGSVTVTQGMFYTLGYSLTATSLSSSNSNNRTINLGSSTVTLSANAAVNFLTSTGLTFNAGTSTIVCSSLSATVTGGGMTFYDIQYTSTAGTTHALDNVLSARNVSVSGRTISGVASFIVTADTAITGTLTLSAGTNATMRTFVRSNTIGTARTLTCANVASLQDIDFRDITIDGAAAPVSGTRLGDCKGNSGITFDSPKTVYWRSSGGGSFSDAGWALSPTSPTGSTDFFPLAQDTVVFDSAVPSIGSTMTVNAAYNIGTIDMSARTSNTMTLATGSQNPVIYGNWINGTGTALMGTGTLTFAGRGSQTITSAGKTFPQGVTTNSPGGGVTQQDALITTGTLGLSSGTYDANGYNLTALFVSSANTGTRTLALGFGTWTVTGGGTSWNTSLSTNLTVTGTGTIRLTSTSGKTFGGGGIQTWPTLNQGGTGTLTITGSNKFANITNTALGRVQFTGGTTNTFTNFNLNGTSTSSRLPVGSTNTTQAILVKGSAWNVGSGSLNSGNNTGLSFTGTSPNFLNISYINGQVVIPTVSSGDFFQFLV